MGFGGSRKISNRNDKVKLTKIHTECHAVFTDHLRFLGVLCETHLSKLLAALRSTKAGCISVSSLID